jgi:hypothetical protein
MTFSVPRGIAALLVLIGAAHASDPPSLTHQQYVDRLQSYEDQIGGLKGHRFA